MKESELHARLAGAGIDGIGTLDTTGKDPFVVVDAEALVPALTFLRDDAECSLEMLHLLTAVERSDRLEVVYHVCSLSRHHAFTLKVLLPRPEGGDHDSWRPEVPSVAGVYRAADWHEREQWDLLGVRFTGHPDLRRILLPEDWVGHPLRKDYVYPSEHGEIPLELDATPIYERGADWSPEKERRPARPAGAPLVQPLGPASQRPDGGGVAPATSKGERHHIGPKGDAPAEGHP